MYTKEAMHRLGVLGPGPGRNLDQQQAATLDRDGFVIVPGVLSPGQCAAMAAEFDRLYAAEGQQGGHEVHVEPGAPRVSNIFNKTAGYDDCLALGPVLQAAHALLGEVKLHGANLRDPLPGKGHQALHCDVPHKFDNDWWVVNAMLLFDPMTRNNGPTRVVPGSHRWAPLNVPAVNAGDWEPAPLDAADRDRQPADLNADYPGQVLVEAPAGAAVICNGALWHGGTTHHGGGRRRMLHLTYTRRDLPQQLDQRAYLTPFLYDRLDPVQRWLFDVEGPAPAATAAKPKLVRTGTWPH